MLRPDHCLRFRSPPATTCAPVPAPTVSAAPTPFSCRRLLIRGAIRPSRSRPALLTTRASAGPDAAVARTPEMAQREVARALAAEAEARLGPRLLPSAVPADVAEFRNGAGNAVGSLDVRRGAPGSLVQFVFLTLYILVLLNESGALAKQLKTENDVSNLSKHIDFMMQSSLHCKVPNGAIDITSILVFLNASTDAPHFLMELIQGSPTSIVVILDLLPRKDLALHPDYLQILREHSTG
ncbi:hypothetical protein PR202_gb07848 [Eleusine coracana subsp. coracana]|uniref:Uncharacterized protein n=1 Tax=Eleusine coracana subsp. coracana TaxID=191504 RepID=A0AAV5ED75_ELECO|nr:hypothetical protein PR202_gb07848 [Eleusine coracana subsp. coracana]